MQRVLSAACLLLAALPAVAVDEASTVTNIQVKRDSENWPSVILSPSLGFGLPHSVAVSGRVETNGLVPFLYTDTLLRLSFDPLGTESPSFDLPPALVYPTTGLRQRVGFALQGTQIDKVPIITAGKYSNGVQPIVEDGEKKELLQESFEVEQPTQTSDVLFASVDLRPFASSTGPYTVLGAGYMHMARFVGDIKYTIREQDIADHIVSYTQWSVEPRVLLGVANVPFSPGVAGTFVYQPFDLFAIAAEIALYKS